MRISYNLFFSNVESNQNIGIFEILAQLITQMHFYNTMNANKKYFSCKNKVYSFPLVDFAKVQFVVGKICQQKVIYCGFLAAADLQRTQITM